MTVTLETSGKIKYPAVSKHTGEIILENEISRDELIERWEFLLSLYDENDAWEFDILPKIKQMSDEEIVRNYCLDFEWYSLRSEFE